MDITQKIINGELKIEELDPTKTYIFRLGDETYLPLQEDLIDLRNMIVELNKGGVTENLSFMITSGTLKINEYDIEELEILKKQILGL